MSEQLTRELLLEIVAEKDRIISLRNADIASLTARAVRAEQLLTELQTLVAAFVRDYGQCGDWDEDRPVAERFFADAVNLLGKLSTRPATP